MSFAELKERVAALSREEQLDLAAMIAHQARSDDAQYQLELDRRLAEIETGKKFGREDFERLDEDLSSKGR